MRYPARPIRVLVLPLPGPATISAGVGAAMAACWNSSGWDEGDRKGPRYPCSALSTAFWDEGDRKGPLPTSSTAPALTMDESASSGDEGDASVPTELASGIEGDAIDWGGGSLNRLARRLRRADWETSKMVLSLVGEISWVR